MIAKDRQQDQGHPIIIRMDPPYPTLTGPPSCPLTGNAAYMPTKQIEHGRSSFYTDHS
jgi:hypothetical protein